MKLQPILAPTHLLLFKLPLITNEIECAKVHERGDSWFREFGDKDEDLDFGGVDVGWGGGGMEVEDIEGGLGRLRRAVE